MADMTIDEAAAAIRKHLQGIIKQPNVTVKLVRAASWWPVTKSYLVGPNGKINFGEYGQMKIAGKTVAEVEKMLESMKRYRPRKTQIA